VDAYSVNEVTVNWNSAFAWLSNWAAEQSDAAGACRVSYTAHAWQSGLAAELTVTNTSAAAWNGWQVEFAFAGKERLKNGWSAKWTQSRQEVTAKNLSWNRRVSPGDTVSIGFLASNRGPHTLPARFAVNGQTCQADSR
jgi:endoglucanase